MVREGQSKTFAVPASDSVRPKALYISAVLSSCGEKLRDSVVATVTCHATKAGAHVTWCDTLVHGVDVRNYWAFQPLNDSNALHWSEVGDSICTVLPTSPRHAEIAKDTLLASWGPTVRYCDLIKCSVPLGQLGAQLDSVVFRVGTCHVHYWACDFYNNCAPSVQDGGLELNALTVQTIDRRRR